MDKPFHIKADWHWWVNGKREGCANNDFRIKSDRHWRVLWNVEGACNWASAPMQK